MPLLTHGGFLFTVLGDAYEGGSRDLSCGRDSFTSRYRSGVTVHSILYRFLVYGPNAFSSYPSSYQVILCL
jgi:hypothetical protein